MVAPGLERGREPREDAATVVRDGRRLAVHDLAGRSDLAAEDLHERLVAGADAESRGPDGQATQDSGVVTCLLRPSGSR